MLNDMFYNAPVCIKKIKEEEFLDFRNEWEPSNENLKRTFLWNGNFE